MAAGFGTTGADAAVTGALVSGGLWGIGPDRALMILISQALRCFLGPKPTVSMVFVHIATRFAINVGKLWYW